MVRFPLVLFVGALLKGCTEGGNGAGGKSDGDWDPGHRVTETSRHIRAGQWDQLVDGLPAPLAALGAGAIVALVLTVIVLAVAIRAFLHGGWIAVHQEILRDGVARWGTLFSGLTYIGPMVAWSFLQIAILTGVAVCVVPALLLGGLANPFVAPVIVAMVGAAMIYVGLGLSLGAHVIVIEGQDVASALRRSWALVEGNRVHLLIFYIVMLVVRVASAAVGLLACCVGTVVTGALGLAVGEVAFTDAFLRHTRPQTETDGYAAAAWK